MPGDAGVELEFKFLVDGEAAFDALARALGAEPTDPVRQVNRFFDTPGHDLRRVGLTLRLREEGGRFRATAKGPARPHPGDPGLAIRPEEEVELDPEQAAAVGAGRLSLAEAFGEPAGSSALLGSIRALLEGRPTAEVGTFVNHRRRLGPVALAGLPAERAVLFELDRTELPGGRVDHEIEVEVAAGAEEAAGEALRALLRRAGVAWRPATNKVRRFFEALAQSQPAAE